jgi:large-conductance mechanosensitive channel
MSTQNPLPTPSSTEITPEKLEVKAHIKSGKMRGRKVTVLLDADDLVKEQVGGFVNFVREHAIVGLAVGFIIGQQAQGVIKQLVDSFMTPVLTLLFGNNLKALTFNAYLFGHTATFTWGAMMYVLINLIFVLATIYILIKIFKLDKLDKPTPAVAATPAATKKAKK